MPLLHYPTVLFDWGDTVMRDDPASTVPMVEWPTVDAISGIESVLAYLQSSGRRIILATSASISDETQIRAALARVALERYFSRIYCFKSTGLPKGEGFYQYILRDLSIHASEALMVGDSFEKDILAANNTGMFAIWFNPRSNQTQTAESHITVHRMGDLVSFLAALDQA